MRIAVLADIHSNFAALEAVVAEIQQASPDHVIVAGDFANRGPEPEPVMRLLCELGWPLLRGNHEDYVLGQVGPSRAADPAEAAMWQPARWTAEQIVDFHTLFQSLPMHHSLQGPDGSEVFVTHGTPRGNSEGIYPNTSDSEVCAMLESVKAPLVCVAHTHYSLVRHCRDSLVVNVGSVGLPFNGDWRAQFAILDWREGKWEVALQKVEYDRDRTMAAFERSGFLQGGGPMARLIRNEVRDARPYLGGFVKMFGAKVREGIVGVEAAVEEFEALPGIRLAEFWSWGCG